MVGQHAATRRRSKRGGLTFLEFLGCFSALIGGVFLGSMYLGVDLKSTLLAVVQQAHGQSLTLPAEQRLNNAPAVEIALPRTAGPGEPLASSTGTSNPPLSMSAGTPPAIAPTETTSLAAPFSEVANDEPPKSPTLSEVLNITPEQRQQLTDAYWAALNSCMNAELASRASAVSASGDWQLYNYLAARHEGHQQAATAIAALNHRGVDAHITAYAHRARAWHEAGAQLYARANDLLTDAPTAQLSGPFAQSWQSAATQHQMEERLLGEKRAAVQAYLDHRGETAGDSTAASTPSPQQPASAPALSPH